MVQANIPRRSAYDVPNIMLLQKEAKQQAGYQNAMIGLQAGRDARQIDADAATEAAASKKQAFEMGGRIWGAISQLPPEVQVEAIARAKQDPGVAQIMEQFPEVQSLVPDARLAADPATVGQVVGAFSDFFSGVQNPRHAAPSAGILAGERWLRDNPGKNWNDWLEFEASLNARGGAAGTPYYNFFYTPEGIRAGNARTGEVVMAPGGGGVRRTADDPAVRGAVAGAQETGKAVGAAVGKAQVDLPRVIDQAEATVGYIDELLEHPAFKSAVGATLKPFVRFVEGSPEADFMGRLGQVQDAAFLQAFAELKGGGHITEIEGIKATRAISRMSKSSSEEEFRLAAKDYKDVIRNGVKRARWLASGSAAASTDQFVVGKTYEDASGNRAVYLGGGRWEQK